MNFIKKFFAALANILRRIADVLDSDGEMVSTGWYITCEKDKTPEQQFNPNGMGVKLYIAKGNKQKMWEKSYYQMRKNDIDRTLMRTLLDNGMTPDQVEKLACQAGIDKLTVDIYMQSRFETFLWRDKWTPEKAEETRGYI